MQNKRVLIAHLAILSACAIWGLMAPIGKDAMLSGVDNLNMVYLRALGGAVFFWITSLFTKHEHGGSRHNAPAAGLLHNG